MIRDVLALTSPRDSVFDAYGLYIFRPHATYYYYYYLSTAQFIWLQTELMREKEIMEDLRRNHCKVVIFSPRLLYLPENLLRFLRLHYLGTGFGTGRDEVLVAGRILRPGDLAANRATVSLVASAEYAVQARGGTPRVSIDGQLYHAPLFLAQGDRQVLVEGDFDSLVIIYSRVLTLPLPRLDRPPTGRQDRPLRLQSQSDDDQR